MATQGTPLVPLDGVEETADAAVQRPWRMRARLSSFVDRTEVFLDRAGFDRGPWLAVGLGSGIGLWFLLAKPWQWVAVFSAMALVALGATAIWGRRDDRAQIVTAAVSVSWAIALGVALIWTRSAVVGVEPIERPTFQYVDGTILEREEQPARDRVRLTVAARDAELARAVKYRVNVLTGADRPELAEGARIRFRSRLMPPSAPILPGSYDFARRAWFDGLAATGSVVGDIEIVERAAPDEDWLASVQRKLSSHVREQLGGSPGTIAAAFASGDRGAIAERDEEAMRDSGLTHLLSISGLHVSAVIAAAYFLALKILALWPWLTLRVRLPLLAAAIGALAGIAYTLLTGAQVPTVRSCVGAVLVLIALALGREPLSLRMVAVAACVVLLLWPESLVGPSFQMSFAAVIVIVALHNMTPVRAFLAPRDEAWPRWFTRRIAMLFLTGLAIELALMPIVLFHFHRAGLYGAVANIIAIPLVTFVSMPLIAAALLFDLAGMGGPAWWMVGQSLDLLLAIAHFTAEQPGAVKLTPRFGVGTLLLFVGGGLWIALWKGKFRLAGLLPITAGALLIVNAPVPDVLISRDGRDVGIAGQNDRLLVLRDSEDSYARQNLVEIAAMPGQPIPFASWEKARCSKEFCSVAIERGARTWTLLVARNRDLVEERALAAACGRADIVIADRFLPRSCNPRWLKADRRFLEREGGAALYLSDLRIDTVADSQGQHGWWPEAGN